MIRAFTVSVSAPNRSSPLPGASGHVSALGRARLHAEQIGCTPLEKTALSMAARVMNKVGET